MKIKPSIFIISQKHGFVYSQYDLFRDTQKRCSAETFFFSPLQINEGGVSFVLKAIGQQL